MAALHPSFAELLDPGMHPIDLAEQMARQLMTEGQRIPERIALGLQGEPPPDNARAERMLELLGRIAEPARLLPLLDRAMPSSNERIRAKAWKLYMAASADLGWVDKQLEESDARVSGNLVEALWRATPSEELRRIFWKASIQDQNRVAGNGLTGLFQMDDVRAPGLAEDMAEREDPAFRATAAWVIGRVYWLGGIGILEKLRQDRIKKVRLNAEKSLLRIRRKYPSVA